MAARFCTTCGRPIAPNANFCASCGTAQAATPPPGTPAGVSTGYPAPPPPAPAAYYPGYPAYPAYPVSPAGPTAASRAADRSALSNVQFAAILGLIGAALSIATLFVTPAFSFVSYTTTSSGTSVSLNMTALWLFAALGAAGLILTIVELWLYREAYRELTPHDARFSSPASLTLMALIALILLIAVGAALVALVYEAIVCAGSGNPITSSCISLGEALGLLALVGILAIVLLIGFIGFLIGVWRLGSRYSDGMFKAAAILLIFPVLNIVGTILILIAARSALEKLGAAQQPLSFG